MNEVVNVEKGDGRYRQVLSECKIGPVNLPNRVVYPAWQLNYANTDGTVSDKLVKYYTDLARGGCGLIFTGAATVSGDGIPFDRVMRVDTDAAVPGLTKLFAAIKGLGAVPAIQIVHYGRQSSTSVSGDTLMAPSAIRSSGDVAVRPRIQSPGDDPSGYRAPPAGLYCCSRTVGPGRG